MTMSAKKTTPKTATTKNAKAAKTAKAPEQTPAPDIIDAGGGILVEIAPPPAKASKKSGKARANAKNAKAEAEAKPKKMSALDAAAKVLAESGEPMNAKTLIEAMAKKGLWTSPGGKTPHATLFAAILREINTKGKEARFTKASKGHFAATKNA
jgi:hypothetical protein